MSLFINLNCHSKKGFTLVELLVSIAIIGILTSTVIKMSSNSRTKAINSNIQSSLAQLATIASDSDRLNTGNNATNACNLLFGDPDMQKLVNFAAEEAGREVVYTYCSKDSNDYRFTFIAPKVEGDGTYFCVDQNSGVREVDYSNITSILSDYSCNSVAAESEDPSVPVTIVSAIYNSNQSLTLTFNQSVYYQSVGESGYASVFFSDSMGVQSQPTSFGSASRPYLDGSDNVTFAFNSPIICTVTNYPWGSYSQESHYINISEVYGSNSNSVASMSASITCPAPVGSCSGNIDYSGCGSKNTDSHACSQDPLCSWSGGDYSCAGTPIEGGVCNTVTVEECDSISGCYLIQADGTCSRNSLSCSDFSASDCPVQYGCSIYWN